MEKAERFGDKIKALRKNHDVTLSEMAMLINLKSKGSLSTLENAKNPPSYETLINIADVFAVKVDWLIGRSSQPYDEEIIFKLENQIMNFRLSADAEFKDIVPDVYADAELRSKIYTLEIRAALIFYLQYLKIVYAKTWLILLKHVDAGLLEGLVEHPFTKRRRYVEPYEKYMYLLSQIAALLFYKPFAD